MHTLIEMRSAPTQIHATPRGHARGHGRGHGRATCRYALIKPANLSPSGLTPQVVADLRPLTPGFLQPDQRVQGRNQALYGLRQVRKRVT